MQKVVEIVRKQLALPAESEVTPDSKFSTLGADSLDTVSVLNYPHMYLEYIDRCMVLHCDV